MYNIRAKYNSICSRAVKFVTYMQLTQSEVEEMNVAPKALRRATTIHTQLTRDSLFSGSAISHHSRDFREIQFVLGTRASDPACETGSVLGVHRCRVRIQHEVLDFVSIRSFLQQPSCNSKHASAGPRAAIDHENHANCFAKAFCRFGLQWNNIKTIRQPHNEHQTSKTCNHSPHKHDTQIIPKM